MSRGNLLLMLSGLRPERRRRLALLAIIVLLPLAALSTARGAAHILGDPDPCDLTPYWLSAHLTRAGVNPYRAYSEDMALVRSLVPDSPDFTTRCQASLEDRKPFTTPWQILMTIPLSWLSLRGAVLVWTLLQIACGALIPLVMLRYNEEKPDWRVQAIGVGLVLAWAPTRMALGHGKITLLIILMSSLAILLGRRGRQVQAGIAMGLALTKYTLAVGPLFVMLVYRYYKALGVAVLVQVLGFVLLGVLVGESPLQVGQTFLTVVSTGAETQAGIPAGVVSLDRWLQALGLSATLALVASVAAGALLLLALVLPHYAGDLFAVWKAPGPRTRLDRRRSNLLLAITVPLTLLFSYHRIYDLTFLFISVALFAGARLPAYPGPRERRRYRVGLTSALLLSVVLLIPPSLVARLGPSAEDLALTGLLAVALAASIWLLHDGESNEARLSRPAPVVARSR